LQFRIFFKIKQIDGKGDVVDMGMKGAVFLSIILFSVMFIIIVSTVPEGNLRSILIGLSTGSTVLIVNFIAKKVR
jgi:hypothetical protein